MLNDFHSSTGSGPPGQVRPPGNSRRGPRAHEASSSKRSTHLRSNFATTNETMKGNAPSVPIQRTESWHRLDGHARSIGSCGSDAFTSRIGKKADRVGVPTALCLLPAASPFTKSKPIHVFSRTIGKKADRVGVPTALCLLPAAHLSKPRFYIHTLTY